MTDELLDQVPAWQRRIAEAHARHPIVKRPRLRDRFVKFAGAHRGDAVLDVFTGAGFNAFAFARRAKHVAAVDSRGFMLMAARRGMRRRRLPNVTITEADPLALPFADDTFEIVTAAAAVHHLALPQEVLAEMARVCVPGGAVALEDIIASEQNVRAKYQNRIERLRDRSHQRVLSLSELVATLGRVGLMVRKVEVQESVREFNEWIAVTRPPVRRSERIWHLLQGSVERDMSGLGVQAEDDTFLFVQRVAWILATKPCP